MVMVCSHGSDSVRPSRRPFWQLACPFLASGDHFRTFRSPAPTGAAAVSSSSGRSAAAAGMLPWARGLAVLYTTRMAAWTPSLGLRGLFLAALHHSQNQKNRFELHVVAWYCFAPMGPTLCARLDDPSCSQRAHSWPQGTTFGHVRPPLRQVRLQYHRRPAGLPQPLG